MTLQEAIGVIQEAHRLRAGQERVTFSFPTFGSRSALYNQGRQFRREYPRGGSGGGYRYLDANDRVIYVGRSAGTVRELKDEAVGSKLGAPRIVDATQDIARYERHYWLSRPVAEERRREITEGRFYLCFIFPALACPFSQDQLVKMSSDLEAHLLYHYKLGSGGALPPLNTDDDSEPMNTLIPWGD
jgi:hypothetical protein